MYVQEQISLPQEQTLALKDETCIFTILFVSVNRAIHSLRKELPAEKEPTRPKDVVSRSRERIDVNFRNSKKEKKKNFESNNNDNKKAKKKKKRNIDSDKML